MAIDVDGLDGLIARLDGLIDDEQTVRAMQKACLIVERNAKTKAPKALKNGGSLRNSIKSRVEKDGENIIGIVFSPLEYAPYVEYGTGLFAEKGGRKTGWAYEDEETGETIWTRGQRPQPYLRPALNENREKILQILKEGVKND